MTHRFWAVLYGDRDHVGLCSLAFGQSLVSAKLLPAPAAVRAGSGDARIGFGAGDDSPNQARRHTGTGARRGKF